MFCNGVQTTIELWLFKHFIRYRTAAELNKKRFDVQVCSLISGMSVEAEQVYSTFTIQQDNSNEADNTTSIKW